MKKPRQPRLSTDGSFDLDLTERVARQLQDSDLHVLEALAMSALPEALRTGAPEDDYTSIHVILTLVTDGRRGVLILCMEDEAYDAEAETTELVDCLCPGGATRGTFVVRGATMIARSPAARARSLDLSDPATVRARVEAAYEEAFAGAPAVDRRELFLGFQAYGCPVKTEREVRRFLLDIPGPADAPEAFELAS